MNKKILDVGCGANKIGGSTGMDHVKGPGVDIVHDLNKFPWPIAESSFDEVRMAQIIEHVDDILKTMAEVWRISKPGAKISIYTPHFSSPNSYTDPTHKWHLAYGSFDLLTEEARYDYGTVRFKIVDRKITFGKSVLCWPGRLMAACSPGKYERHFCYLFPAHDLQFFLETIKN